MSNRSLLVCALGFLGLGVAHGTTIVPNGTTGIEYVTGGYRFVDGPGAGSFQGRTFANPVTRGGAVGVIEQVGFAGRNGGAIVATVSRTMSSAAVASAVAGVGAAFWGGCAAGTAFANWAGMGNGSNNGSRMSCNLTDWLFDEGQAPVSLPAVSTLQVSGPCSDPAGMFLPSGLKFTSLGGMVAEATSRLSKCTTRNLSGYIASGGTYAVQFERYLNGSWLQLTWQSQASTPVNGCPAVTDFSNPAYSVPSGGAPGPDGKCPTGRYTAASNADAAARFAPYAGPYSDAVLGEFLSKGGTLDGLSPRGVTGVTPSTQTGSPTTTTTTSPSGAQTVTTATPSITYTFNGDTITYNETTVTTTVNGGDTTTTTTVTPGANAEAQEFKTCGRPDSPPCKIDETGTPTHTPKNTGQDMTTARKPLMDCIVNMASCVPGLPSLNWSFSLPSHCSVIALPAFSEFMDGIDVCQFQPTIHDLMGLLWVAAGLFGSVGLVLRDATGGA